MLYKKVIKPMYKKKLVALSVLLALVGCGGSDGDSNHSGGNNGNGGTGGEITPPVNSLITSWPMSKVKDEFQKTTVTEIGTSTICGGSHPAVETEHFIVSSPNGTLEEIKSAAKITQVSFDELLVHTKFTPEELNISTGNKWSACFSNENIGTDNYDGTGYANSFEFKPGTIDVNNADFIETSILAKHELFHTIQAELLGDKNPFEHLPRWFQEGSAELFAGRTIKSTSHKHDEFLLDTSRTPLSIITWNDEQELMSDVDIKNVYENHMYDLYHENVNYLVAKGLKVTDTLNLIQDSHGNAFDTAIGAVEEKLNLTTPYIELRDDKNSYRANVIATLNQQEVSGPFKDDIPMDALEVMIFQKGQLDIPHAKGTVNRAQNQYALIGDSIANGNYDAYVTVDDLHGGDLVYGPITISVKNGALGQLDFTGAPEFTD